MMASSKNDIPQEGTCLSEAGESLTGSPSGSVCPSYSGGGKNRHEGLGPQPDDPRIYSTDSEIASETSLSVVKEARVLLTRCLEIQEEKKGEGRVVPRPRTLSESSSASGMSFGTVASRTSSPIGWRKRQRAVIVDSDDYDDASPSAKSRDRRGRGLPPSPSTEEEYAGLARAKAQLNAAEAEELRLEAERGMAEDARRRRETRVALSRKAPVLTKQGREEPETLDLERVVSDSLDTIRQVAGTSRHLKGTFVRALNEAAEAIKTSFVEMRSRTMSEEVARLEAANAKLAAELAEVRRELARLQPAPAPAPSVEEIARACMVQCGTMLNARLEGLEERLLPAKRLRPPLAADSKKLATVPAAAAAPAATRRPTRPPPMETAVVAAPAPSTKPAKRKAVTKRVAAEPTPPPPESQPQPQLRPQPMEEPWSVVVRRGAKKAKKKKAAGKPAVEPAPAPAAPKKKAAPPKRRVTKLHAPRTTAVMLTLQPEAVERGVTYLKVLGEAKRRINLKDIGIDGLRFGTASTGARLLILPGAGSAEKADALASRIKEAVGEDIVRVSRPEKCVDMRISGLDDSVTKDELVEAVAEAGGCATTAIRAGEITRSGRNGQIFLSCPIAAAKIVAAKRLRVGWVSVQAKILDRKTPRCYRCLETGHVGATCASSLDRSGLCFCCGKAGHKAAQCTAEPHCAVCDAAGRPANHRLGGKACPRAPPKGRTGRGTAGGGSRAPPVPS